MSSTEGPQPIQNTPAPTVGHDAAGTSIDVLDLPCFTGASPLIWITQSGHRIDTARHHRWSEAVDTLVQRLAPDLLTSPFPPAGAEQARVAVQNYPGRPVRIRTPLSIICVTAIPEHPGPLMHHLQGLLASLGEDPNSVAVTLSRLGAHLAGNRRSAHDNPLARFLRWHTGLRFTTSGPGFVTDIAWTPRLMPAGPREFLHHFRTSTNYPALVSTPDSSTQNRGLTP